jgi:hypothetical protein
MYGSIGQYTNMGIGVQHGLADGSEYGLLALAWDAKSYNAGSLKTFVQRVSDKTEGTLIGGQRMAQTRRVGKDNQRAYLKRRGFRPTVVGKLMPTDPFALSPCRLASLC